MIAIIIIISGGLDVTSNGLREQCLTEMVKRDLPGYAIGGNSTTTIIINIINILNIILTIDYSI